MSTADDALRFDVTRRVRDTCLCLHLQQAARAVARRFDAALRPLGLTNGQFSLLMSLNRPRAARIGDVSELLAMDRTTLTASLKPLERRGLVTVSIDDADKRSRRLTLTPTAHALLVAAVPVWETEHAAIEGLFDVVAPDRLRADLRTLATATEATGHQPSRSGIAVKTCIVEQNSEAVPLEYSMRQNDGA
jgi:DNA-binding MarR family transcriptional regulator